MGLLNSVILQARPRSWDYSSCIMMSEKEHNLKCNRSEILHRNRPFFSCMYGPFQTIEWGGIIWNFPKPCLYSEDRAPGDL